MLLQRATTFLPFLQPMHHCAQAFGYLAVSVDLVNVFFLESEAAEIDHEPDGVGEEVHGGGGEGGCGEGGADGFYESGVFGEEGDVGFVYDLPEMYYISNRIFKEQQYI